MNFVTLPAALTAAAIALPLLLLLYILKLRRVEQQISSTFLWRKAVQDLQVNAPFQRMRKSLLLLLQLLLLIAVLVAMAGPVMNFVGRPERNVILLMDQSASMKAIEPDGRPRLEHARDAAIEFVDNLADGSKAMIIAFSSRAEVICTFTGDRRRLQERLESIAATDGPSRLGEALQLAAAYSSNVVENAGAADVAPRRTQIADIELFSDGRLSDAAEERATEARVMLHTVGSATDNVGITTFDVSRAVDRPGVVTVFAELRNFGEAAVELDASLFLDERLLSVEPVTLGPAMEVTTRPDVGDVAEPRANVLFEFEHDAGGIIEVKLSRGDALAADNVVRAPIDPPRPIHVLVVTDEEELRYLFDRVFREALEISDVTMMTPGEYETAADARLVTGGRSAFDLVVLAGHSTDRLAPGNYIFFGGIPKVEGVSFGDVVDEPYFVTWQENHPLLRYVGLDNVFTVNRRRLNLPDHAARLVEGESETAFALLADPGHRYVIVAFDLLDSTFRMQPAFPIFMQNAVSYLSGGAATDIGRLIAPGSVMAIQPAPGARTMTVRHPGGEVEEIDIGGRHTVTFGRTRAVGTYTIRFDDEAQTTEVYCVNVLDPVESLIRPNSDMSLAGATVASVSGEVEVNRPMWPYAVGAALVLLLIEWWVYNRRVMI